jgi:hypothetical protein
MLLPFALGYPTSNFNTDWNRTPVRRSAMLRSRCLEPVVLKKQLSCRCHRYVRSVTVVTVALYQNSQVGKFGVIPMHSLACFAVFLGFLALSPFRFARRIFHPFLPVRCHVLRACSRGVPEVRVQTLLWVFVICFRLLRCVSRLSALFFYCCARALFDVFLLVLLFFSLS